MVIKRLGMLGMLILSGSVFAVSERAPRPPLDTGDLSATGSIGQQFIPTVVNGFSFETATINNLTVTGTATFTGLINAATAQLVLPVSGVAPTTNLMEGSVVDVGGLLYMYDATRNTWLSVDRQMVWSARAGTVTNSYLRMADSVSTGATGFQVMRDATITGISVSSGGTVWLVASVGGDFPDLQTALASPSVVNGDTIKIAPQIFTTATQITVNKSVTIEGCGTGATIQTAGTAGDPTNVLNITVGDVVVSNITLLQRKTTNTTVESAIAINAPAATGIIIDRVSITTMEYGIVINAAAQFSIEHGDFHYQGAAGNTHRFIAVYTNNGNSRIIHNTFTASSDFPTTRTIFCALLSGPYAGSLLFDNNVQIGGNLRQFYIQEGFAGAAGGFQLYIANNTYNDQNGGFILFDGANVLNLFSSIVLTNNTVSNGAGKGLIGLDGFGSGLTPGSTTWYINGNTIANPAITAPGWASASTIPGAVGYNTAVFAPFTITYSSVIPTPPTPPVKFTAQVRLNGCPTAIISAGLFGNNGFATNLNVPIVAGDRIQTYLLGMAVNPTVGVEYAGRI